MTQDSLDIWTFADEFRATVKTSTNITNARPILTGMAIGLNSSLSIAEGNKKLPPCPILFLSNNEGVLQVYYYVHKNLPSICHQPEVIKQIQPSLISQRTTPSTTIQSSMAQQPTNGFAFKNVGNTPTIQPTEHTISNIFTINQQPIENKTNQQPLQTTNGSSIADLSKTMSMKTFTTPTSTKISTANEQPSSPIVDNKKFVQMIEQFQSRLDSLAKPISKSSEPSVNSDKSLEQLRTTLKDMETSVQKSIRTIKSLTNEHIDSTTKIEDARHQITLSQKENLYDLLKDRELDPWTQSRLDSIKTKYDQIKHDLNVLLQLTRTTIHDKSLSIDDDEIENEDFLPDLELSLNTNETMRLRIKKRIRELSHKVTETDKDIQDLCSKLEPLSLNTDSSNSKMFDSTFTKTTMSSDRSFYSSDAQILSYLQSTHSNVTQIHVPPAAVINLSSMEQKKQSAIEITKPITPSIQPSTPKQPTTPSTDSESYKNMLRIVHTSIDLFSGVTSPEQLQELSSTIANSPLSSTHKSIMSSANKTPTISKTSTITKPLNTTNTFQTPAKSIASPVPTISVTPATPATQVQSSDASLKLQLTKPVVQTATDLSRSQTVQSTGDMAIRSLLNNTVSTSSTIPSNISASVQVSKPTSFSSAPTIPFGQTSLPATVIPTSPATQPPFSNLSSPSSTITTSVQSTSPTTKPIVSTDFGSKPLFGNTGLNSMSTSLSNMPFGNTPATTNTGSGFGSAPTATTSAAGPFGSGFGTTTTTSASSTSPFGAVTSATTSPFGNATTTTTSNTGAFGTPNPFGNATATATSNTGAFGTPSPFGITATTSAPSSSVFGAVATTSAPSSGFGAAPAATSPFGNSFGAAASTPTTTLFGGGFGGTTSPSTGTTFTGFNTGTSPTSNTSTFGSRPFATATTLPVTSTASSSTGISIFGGGGGGIGAPAAFGSTFSGFNTQAGPSAPSTGFSFGGFGSQPSDATAAQQPFNSFGSPPATAQPSSPFGGTIFGGATQPPGFGAASSSFGASSTQSASSPSFTAYRK